MVIASFPAITKKYVLRHPTQVPRLVFRILRSYIFSVEKSAAPSLIEACMLVDSIFT